MDAGNGMPPPLPTQPPLPPGPPPPLPPGPPPPLPPADTADDAAPSQLAQHFREHKASLACQLLLNLSTKAAARELQAAFRAVEWAPSAFLLTLAQWPATAPRHVFFALVATGNECMTQWIQQQQQPPSPMISDLAGALLLDAFHDCRAHTCAAFVVVFNVSVAHLHAHCQRMLYVHAKLVVTLLDVLGKRSLLPLDVVVAAALQQNDLEAADAFVRDDAVLQRLYVQMLMDHRVPDKIIKKRLNKFKLSDLEFPEYYARKVRASIRFLVYNEQYEDVLALVQGDAELTLYACHFVVSHRGSTDPAVRLFIYRSGYADWDEFRYIDTTGMASQQFPNKDDLEPLESCLSIKDLIGEDACVFVDTPEALAACVAHLREAPVVGFDCEWKGVTTRGQQSVACAVLQLASSSKAFVIDAIALQGQCSPLSEVFLSESVLKLGFDVKGDVSALATVLPQDGTAKYTGGSLMRNLVDMQKLAKRLKSVKRPRLTNEQTLAAKNEDLEDGEVEEGEVANDGAKNDQEGNGDGLDSTEQVDATALPSPADDCVTAARKQLKKKQKRRNGRAGGGAGGGGNGSNLSLATVAELYLGKPLDKRSRMSDWERRPLTKAQLHYAAMDALVLVKIYEAMRERFSSDECNKAMAQISHSRGAGATGGDRSEAPQSPDASASGEVLTDVYT